MTKDDITRMAREAGGGTTWWPLHTDTLERFAELVAAAEREACAELAFEMLVQVEGYDFDVPDAIRARGNT